MDPEECEKQYSPSRWCSRLSASDVVTAHINAVTRDSLLAKEQLLVECSVYGPGERQAIDVFKNQLTPRVSMPNIISEVLASVKYILTRAKEANSRGVYLCGHSAGGHLAATVLNTKWESDFQEANFLKGAVLVSGVYDLRPLVDTSVNTPLRMSIETAWECSPARVVVNAAKHNRRVSLLVVVGEEDSPEFHRQSRQYEQSLRENGFQTRLLCVRHTDHFNVADNLADKDYMLTQAIVKFMGL